MKDITPIATGRAAGKLILLGEHAVVHGTQALAIGLSDTFQIEATYTQGPLSLIFSPHRQIFATDASSEGNALRQLVQSLNIPPQNITLTVKTQLPTQAGLGSSAAIATASARAIANLTRTTLNYDQLFQAVQSSEQVFHGTPSGLDASASILGGVIRYSRSKGPNSLNASTPPIMVVHSGEPKNTITAVSEFSKKLKTTGMEGQLRLEQIDNLVENGIEALAQKNYQKLGQLMTQNHAHLDWFGVSSPTLNEICKIGLDLGALGAKLTGGGKGGCAILVAQPQTQTKIKSNLEKRGYQVVHDEKSNHTY